MLNATQRIQTLTRPHLFAMTNGRERDQWDKPDLAFTARERREKNKHGRTSGPESIAPEAQPAKGWLRIAEEAVIRRPAGSRWRANNRVVLGTGQTRSPCRRKPQA